MKKNTMLTILLVVLNFTVNIFSASADPLISTSQLVGSGKVASSTQAFLQAIPNSEQTIGSLDGATYPDDKNKLGKVSNWGKSCLNVRLNSYSGYKSPEEVTISYKTEEAIHKGDICLIKFQTNIYWAPESGFNIKFGLKDGNNVYKTDIIQAIECGIYADGIFTWAKNNYYAFEANADYSAGSNFEIYLGFTNGQQGAICEVEMRNLSTEYSLRLVNYVIGREKLTTKQTVTFGQESGYKTMALNDDIVVKFNAPVSSNFKMNDFYLSGGDGRVDAFELSEDKKQLNLTFQGLKPNTAYSLVVDNIITEEIDYLKREYNFQTTEGIVIDTGRLSATLPDGTVRANVTPTALKLKNGINHVSININNPDSSPTVSFAIAVVYTGTKTNFSKADGVYVGVNKNVGSFDTLAVDVPISKGANQFVKLYVWNNLVERAPLCDEFLLNCSN